MANSKKPRMTVAKFIPMYLAAVEAGTTREEFARQLGVKPDTIYQRVYDLNRQHGAALPQLPSGGRISMADQVQAAIAAYRGGKKQPERTGEDVDLEALLQG